MSPVVVWHLLLLCACVLLGAHVLKRVPRPLALPPVAGGLLGLIGTGLALSGTVTARRASAGEWPALHHVEIGHTTTELVILGFACLTAAFAVELVPSTNRWAQLALRTLYLLTCVLTLAQGPASPPQITLLMALIVWPVLMVRSLWEGALRGLGHPSARAARWAGVGLGAAAVVLALLEWVLLGYISDAVGARGIHFLLLAALPGAVVLLLSLSALYVMAQPRRPGAGASTDRLAGCEDGDAPDGSGAPRSRSLLDSALRALFVAGIGLLGVWVCYRQDAPGPALALVVALVVMAVVFRDAGFVVGTVGMLVIVVVIGWRTAMWRIANLSASSVDYSYWELNRRAFADGGVMGRGAQAWWLGTSYGEPRTRLDSGFLGMISVRGGWVALLGLALLVVVLVVALWRAGAVAPGTDGGVGAVLARTGAVSVVVFGLWGVLASYGLAPWIGWPAPLGLTRLGEATWLIGVVTAVGILLETDRDDEAEASRSGGREKRRSRA